jgi:hypothetical protein
MEHADYIPFDKHKFYVSLAIFNLKYQLLSFSVMQKSKTRFDWKNNFGVFIYSTLVFNHSTSNSSFQLSSMCRSQTGCLICTSLQYDGKSAKGFSAKSFQQIETSEKKLSEGIFELRMRVKAKCTFASVRFAHLFSLKNPFTVILFAQRTPYPKLLD